MGTSPTQSTVMWGEGYTCSIELGFIAGHAVEDIEEGVLLELAKIPWP